MCHLHPSLPRYPSPDGRAHIFAPQETWPWRGVYLGIVMVYDATDSALNRVHCRLAFTKGPSPAAGWQWVDPGGLTGRDFIPLGPRGPAGTAANAFDSHLCFAGKPVAGPGGEEEWVYYAGSDGKHSHSSPHRHASLASNPFRYSSTMRSNACLKPSTVSTTGAPVRAP